MAKSKASVSASSGSDPSASSGYDPSASSGIIEHILYLCGFADDSTMVEFIQNEGWTELLDVTTISLDKVNDFKTVNRDGSYKAEPLTHHVRKFCGFLLYYLRKCRDLSSNLDTDDVMRITKMEFNDYLGSPEYHTDLQSFSRSTAAPTAVVDEEMTAQEFRKMRRNKGDYHDLKDDKYFNSWNRGFVAIAFTHHTNTVLDGLYVPKTPTEVS